MHTTLAIAQRAPGSASRARARWQPYGAALSLQAPHPTPSRSPYVKTPCSIISSASPYSTPSSSSDSDRLHASSIPMSTPAPPKESKTKYAMGLVDQAVKSICDIWKHYDTPTSLQFPDKSITTLERTSSEILPTSSHTLLINSHQFQRPSPPSRTSSLDLDGPCSTHMVPIKGFVHEVLRRSRTSSCALQAALCYLQAIRPQLPKLSEEEQSGSYTLGEPDLEGRITLATPEDLAHEAFLTSQEFSCDIPTVKVTDAHCVDIDNATVSSQSPIPTDTLKKPKGPSPQVPPMAPLPSPLLCPRRAFLAALILASKFTQDKCYSNRAWAKLSGLPPREIGRCERALGDLLGWRLWVGKGSAGPSASATSLPTARPVTRCRSESDLASPTLAGASTSFLSPVKPPGILAPTSSSLRRCSTLPVEAFAQPQNQSESSDMWLPETQKVFVHEPEGITTPSHLATATDDNDDHCPPTILVDAYAPQSFSSPSTPGLSYSPSSTESSSGDRTMSIIDDNTPLMFAMADPVSELSWTESGVSTSVALQVPYMKSVGPAFAHSTMSNQWTGMLGMPMVYDPLDQHHGMIGVASSWGTNAHPIVVE